MTLEINEHSHKTINSWMFKFSGSGLISDPHMKFQKSQNELSYHKGSENIKYTIVKYGETFYGRHTALIQAVMKIQILKGMTLENNDHTYV